jgi:hypothetical protein
MAKKNSNGEFRPQGTVAILIIFVITLIVLWGSIYLILLGRGGTV